MKKLSILFLTLIALVACDNGTSVVNQRPVAGFNISTTTAYENDLVSFTDISFDIDGEISTWNWEFGNGITSDKQTPDPISYDTKGVYTIKLSVTDNLGLESYEPFLVEVNVSAKPASVEAPKIKWEYNTGCGFQDASLALTPSGNIIFGEDSKSDRGTSNVTLISSAGDLIGGFLGPNVVRSSPAVADDGRYYIGSYSSMFFAFDENAPGAPRISFTGPGNVKYNSPAIDKDGTVFSPQHGRLYSFTDNGSDTFVENWVVEVGHTNIYTSPVIDANHVYVMPSNTTIKAYKKTDGTEVWRKTIGQGNTSPAIGKDGTIYIAYSGEAGSYVDALNPNTGESVWGAPAVVGKNTLMNSGVALCDNGRIYVATYNSGSIACLNQADGSLVWTYPTKDGKGVRSTPAIDNEGNIYFGDDAGNFYVLNSEGEEAYAVTKIGSRIYNSPAIGNDGTIYIGADQTEGSKSHESASKIFAFETTATGPMEGWSMMGGNAQRNGRGY